MSPAFPSLARRCRRAAAGAVLALTAAVAAAQAPQLANPASQHCVAKGGEVMIEKNPRGGQFGVCMFPDNMQCEEWAMMRGQCPAGGIRVTGYATPAARYCAITGGRYTITAASNTPRERGTCAFSTGKTCDAAAYYDGSCTRENAPARTADGLPARVEALFTCARGKSIHATFINTGNSRVQLALSDGRKVTLPHAMSADGARYANKAETIVFWNKGNTAFLQENGQTTYADCAAKR